MLTFPAAKIELCCANPKNDYRTQLHGVFYESSSSLFLACDGVRLVHCPAESFVDSNAPEDVDGIIPVDFWKDMRRRKVASFKIVRDGQPQPLVIDSDGRSARCLDAKFPDWQRVTPEEKARPFIIKLNAKLLYELAQSVGDKDCGVTLHCGAATDSILITGITETVGVLMPYRY